MPRVCIRTLQPPALPPHSPRSLSRGTLVLPAVTPRVVSCSESRAGLPLDCLAAGDGPDDSWQPPAKHDHAVAAFHNILSCVAGMWYTGCIPFLPSSTSTPSLSSHSFSFCLKGVQSARQGKHSSQSFKPSVQFVLHPTLSDAFPAHRVEAQT